MTPNPSVLAAFADKAKGVLVETHRLNASDWEVSVAERHQDDLSNLADYAGNLGLDDAHSSILDLYAYVSVFTEGTLKPTAAQRAELQRLIQDAQAAVGSLSGVATHSSGDLVYLLVATIDVPAGLAPALRQEGFALEVYQDGDLFSDALRERLPQAILAEAPLVGAASELLDKLAPTQPEATRVLLVGIDDGSPSARLQALVAGSDIYVGGLQDPTLASQLRESLSNQSHEPFRVLVVDDDRMMCSYCQSILSRAGMQVETTMEADGVPEHVSRFKPDLVLMDLYLPGVDGMTLTSQLRKQADAVVLPIVFLSGEQSEEARFQAIQVGGDDFLTKPIRPRHLVAAVRSRIKRVRALGKQLTKRRGDASGHMRRGAFIDHLRELKATPPDMPTALLVLTIDQADELRERLSLSVGHELEQAVAMRLASAFASGDRYCLIREFGFGIAISRPRREDLLASAEALRQSVNAQPFKVDGNDSALVVSVGLALLPGEERSVDDWIHSGFAACRTAERLGGNRVEGILAESKGGVSPERLLRIRELLRDADKRNGLVMEFQPLIPLRATESGHYAMVLHLRDPKLPIGGVAREEFVPVARELGLGGGIDRLTLSHALAALDDQRSRNRVTNVLVPIDVLSIDREQLTWIQGELGRNKSSDFRLTLEFDAAQLLELGIAGRLLQRLHADGVMLAAVERSGRMAQLAELERLPLDVLRLPASALQAVEPALAGPLLQSWYASGRKLIVEDVRDLSHVAKFWNLGVDYLQGDSLATAGPRLDFDFSEISLG